MSADYVTFEEVYLVVDGVAWGDGALVDGRMWCEDGQIVEIEIDAVPVQSDAAPFARFGGMLPELLRRYEDQIAETIDPDDTWDSYADEHRLRVSDVL